MSRCTHESLVNHTHTPIGVSASFLLLKGNHHPLLSFSLLFRSPFHTFSWSSISIDVDDGLICIAVRVQFIIARINVVLLAWMSSKLWHTNNSLNANCWLQSPFKFNPLLLCHPPRPHPLSTARRGISHCIPPLAAAVALGCHRMTRSKHTHIICSNALPIEGSHCRFAFVFSSALNPLDDRE